MKFSEDDVVKVLPDPKSGDGIVVNPCDPTDMEFFNGTELVPVGHYVRVKVGDTVHGYHESSLEKI